MNGECPSTVKPPERAQQQRDRILGAAARCFSAHGFHGASMANIAEAARMSPGLIYRYFDSKDAIIQAIIARQLDEHRAGIAALHCDPDLDRRMLELFERWRGEDPEVMNTVLFLEMTAEAARDPKVARSLAEVNRVVAADLEAWFIRIARERGVELTPQQAKARSFALQSIVSGMAIRALREPEVDRAVVAESLRLLLPQLLPPRG